MIAGIFGNAVSESFGGGGRLALLAAALALIGWPLMARYVRGETLSLSQQDFVQAAQAVGVSSPRILWRHLRILSIRWGMPPPQSRPLRGAG